MKRRQSRNMYSWLAGWLAGWLDEKGKTLLKHQEILTQRLGEYFDLA